MTLPLCVRIDVDDSRSAENLKADGWRDIEILETWAGTIWKRQITDISLDSVYPLGRRAVPEDMPACIDIARRAFIYDRLHADPQVPRELADQAKEDWVRRIFATDYMDTWIAEWDGKTAAFASLRHWRGDDRRDFGAVVDLIAVDPDCKGRAIGQRLLRTTLDTVSDGFMHLRAGTQQSNGPARKMYRNLGMNIIYRQRTFHK